MNQDKLTELFTHMEWADARAWRSVMTTEGASSDDSILGTLLHYHLTQRAFLDVWHDRPFKWLKREDFRDASELRNWAREFYPVAQALLSSTSAAALASPLQIPWAHFFEEKMGKPAEDVTMAESMYQVVAHTNHHRGQLNRRIREMGGEPGLVDYIVWIWMERPAPDWSAGS